MVTKVVIAPVSQATHWVSSLMYPWKPDGSLHTCLDPKDLNKTIVREHYKAPTIKEISHQLNGTTYISKLDAKDRFWSIHLNEKSFYMTTFNTHCGRYQFLWIPFGLKMSQEIFQMCMDQVIDHLPSIIAKHCDSGELLHYPRYIGYLPVINWAWLAGEHAGVITTERNHIY